MGSPVLGICYGMQLMTHTLGGEVAPAPHREYGLATIQVQADAPLFASVPNELRVWASHGDLVKSAPRGFQVDGFHAKDVQRPNIARALRDEHGGIPAV